MNPTASYSPPSYGQQLRQGIHQLSLHDATARLHRSSSQGDIVAGPLLRYVDIHPHRQTYIGSCLIVSNHKRAPDFEITVRPASVASHPSITRQHRGIHANTYHIRGEPLETFRNEYTFWRYRFELPLAHEPQVASYTSDSFSTSASVAALAQDNGGGNHFFEFHLPSRQESMRFMFYSCNGFSDIPQEMKDKFGQKEAPLWQDVLDRHDVMPFHVLLGGGDQLYQDRLLHDDFMKPWRDEKDPKKRVAMTLPAAMRDGFEHFYFWNYVINFGFKDNPVVAKAFATIPSVNMWDDHDIIDGYGSYPADMQNADCFQVLFANASRFYYLFQQHTVMSKAAEHGMIPGVAPTCYHIVTSLGRGIVLLSLDARGERTKFDVCQPRSYDVIFDHMHRRLANQPSTAHVLVLTGVPLIYPRLTLFEKAMESASGFNLSTLAGKTGVIHNIISGQLNQWNGDPELLDDMNDHWTAGNHEVERRHFIEKLQFMAREKSVRVSFLGGDVHCCGAGRLYSKDMKQREEGDPYLMVQIISSAIVNIPPPQALLTILNQNSSYITFDGNVEEKMYNLFKRSPNGNTRQNKKLMGMRNYCAGYVDEQTGKMHFWIQAEKEIGKVGTMGYLVEVPRLIFGQAAQRNVPPSLPPRSTMAPPPSRPLPSSDPHVQGYGSSTVSFGSSISSGSATSSPPPLPSRSSMAGPGGFVRPPTHS
ncbi:hypothetical protein DM01DRAFT_1336688 [Hesseltinella vesiculosa]|uniref:PhoD-like phosphatase domain-containing protein n=1 Tax=Hesseltinella vesiculosa TaxID=101127 RepID=A0A1X2GEY0_9FUNG|nr:hypothetical protein DM01DRAFT_1336688 [Hesseltinella vesiculosa]